ncbi:MAG: stage III sporulation protein AG [Lachnospiraceae bacterium]|nr:stage III sporulation protein AG [Lachnospiraceae bacterium]
MIEKVKAMAKDKNNLLVLVLAGVLLMVIALPIDNGKKNEKASEKEGSASENTNNSSYLYEEEENTGAQGQLCMGSAEEYTAMMEQKLEELLGQMEGAGEVRVIITLRSSSEKIVEKDAPVSRTDTAEADSGGGTRTVNSVETGESTVYANAGSYSEPYVIKTISPQVEGVVVLAEGAGSGSVSKNIVDVIQVLFGIDAHQVKVIKLGT